MRCSVAGLEAGQFLITTDPIGHIFRLMNKGISPSLNGVTDLFWWISGMVSGMLLSHCGF